SHVRGFAEAVDAAAVWLTPRIGAWWCDAGQAPLRTMLEDGFWNEFLARTRFTFGDAPALRSAAGAIPLSTLYSGDRLIVAKPVARRLQIRTKMARPEVPLPPAVKELWGRSCKDAA